MERLGEGHAASLSECRGICLQNRLGHKRRPYINPDAEVSQATAGEIIIVPVTTSGARAVGELMQFVFNVKDLKLGVCALNSALSGIQ